MATALQRLTSIANALVNGTATAAQIDALARAYHGLSYAGGDDPGWDTYTAAQKAALAMSGIRGEAKRILGQHRKRTLHQQADQAIDNEFPEAP